MQDASTGPSNRRLVYPLSVVTVIVLFLLPLIMLGIDAARTARFPEAVTVVEWRTQIVAAEGLSGADPHRWRVSADGGVTWRTTSLQELGLAAPSDAEPTQACAPDKPEHCYRVVPGHLRVEETINAGVSWWIAWSVPDNERRRLARCYPDLGEPAEHLSSRALAVVAVEGGHAVVVANGRDGYAVRSPDGTWTRTGFGVTLAPTGQSVTPAPPLEGRSARDAAPQIFAGLLAGLAVIAVAGSAAVWRVARRPVGVAVPMVVAGGLLALTGAYGWRDTNAVLPVVVLIAGLIAAAGGALGVMLIATLRRAARKLAAALAAVIGAAVAAAAAGLFAAWAHGAISYRPATFAAQALSVAGLVAAVALVARWRPKNVIRVE